MSGAEALDLLDWRRRIAALYAEVRAEPDARRAWQTWRATRDAMFASHPQSPIPAGERTSFGGVDYFEYEPDARVLAEVSPTDPHKYEIATSGDGTYSFTRFAVANFEIRAQALALEVYWLDGYGGGLFVPFRDATGGQTSYGAGRYLLDTVKGADLGSDGDMLIFDFNFAYNPSCSYDPKWVCPLAPPPNRLDVPIEAGERTIRAK
jgi:uncharacterized protein (DUF1684 family)